MAVENQDFENDPIIDALGITLDPQPVIPPVDIVKGYFQNADPDFRLHHSTLGIYMQVKLERIKSRGKLPCHKSVLVLRADGNYEEDVKIGYSRRPGEAEVDPMEPTHMALYKTYTYPKTTPWHE